MAGVKRRLEKKPQYSNITLNPLVPSDYEVWLKNHNEKTEYEELKYRPLISVVIPVYNVAGKYLRKCLNSILKQYYDNFEIIVVDDASTKKDTLRTLRRYGKNSKIRVEYRSKNGHISRATNDALKQARGEFVALMDDDDEIPENALYEVVKVLNRDKTLDFIYTDEDKITENGKRRFDPNFKSDWAPDSFYSSNYISHLGVIRRTLIEEVGGFRVGFEGAQDYDLYLRVLEKTDKICHIPKVLYHWRAIPGSTAAEIGNKNYAVERGRKAVEESLERKGIEADVKVAEKVPYYNVFYKIKGEPLVSIIIPTRDQAAVTRQCLESIYEKTTYKNFEIILVNNGSHEKEALELFKEYKKKYKNFKVLNADIEFNYSKLNNLAVKNKGKYIVLLNNDTEILTKDWLEIMLGYAGQKHIGAVGAQLAFPDKKIQHAGVVMGLGGVAGHVLIDKNLDDPVWGGRLSAPYNYSAVTAACLMISRKKWDEVGGLEEKLKVAYNDVDFCLKLLEKGYYNVCVPMVKLYHYESRSRGKDETPEKKARVEQERKYMYKKWDARIRKDEFYNPNYSLKKDYFLDLD